MSRKYKQISFEQRVVLQTLLSQIKRPSGQPNISQIAGEMNISRQSIYNELKRNSSPIYKKYTATEAQKRRNERRKNSNKPYLIENHPKLQEYIHKRLKQDGWSVEGIVKRTNKWEKETKEQIGKIPCIETIYRYIYRQAKDGGEDLRVYLRFSHQRRQKRKQKKDRRGIIKGRKFIEERDKIVEWRNRIGDWEIDTMEMKGHKGYILTMVERCSRYTRARILSSKNAQLCTESIIEMLRPFAESGWVKSITVDNGKEFAYHQKISDVLKAPVYFCRPYSARQKGTIEAIHSQYRRFIPKKMSIEMISQKYLDMCVRYLNHRPRKVLDWKSANETLYLHLQSKLRELKYTFQQTKLSNFQVESAMEYRFISINFVKSSR
jgi:IS30 family transposase